jgi:hypothetical protein
MIPLPHAHILARLFATVAHLGVIWDRCMRFFPRTLIRMMTRIMEIIFANGRPTTGERAQFGIIF